jgi:long-chain fatty acid transport protein
VSLQTIAFNPAVGLKINDEVSVGLGLDIYRSDLNLRQRFPWALVVSAPVPDGTMNFEGNGWGIGGYFGINFTLGDRHQLALTGRLPVSVDYEGDFTIDNIPDPTAALPTSRFTSEIEHPASVGVGYAFTATERLTFGLDFEWLQNSTHDDVPLNIGANQPLLDGKTAVPLAWEDSISVGFGIEYKWIEELTLRAGYLYSDTPMSETTWNPAIPADDRHIFSLGFGYTWDECNTIDFAYSLIHMPNSTITNNITPAFNGVYSYSWDILTLSYSRRF